jgi:hypothetical protein
VTEGHPILFSDLDSLSKALSRLSKNQTPELRTAPHAAGRLGPRYLKAVIDRAHLPVSEAIIDCGDDAGLVLKSLAVGWRRVAFSGAPALAQKLADIAEKRQAKLIN